MSEWFQTVAVLGVGDAAAASWAARIMDWLVDTAVLVRDRTDCVLGSDLGHPPGPAYAMAVTGPDSQLLGLRTNGVEMITARTGAFGNLGVTFWNWPERAPGFLAELGRRVRHDTILTSGKV